MTKNTIPTLPTFLPDPYFKNEMEALEILNLIVAEFESDPMSVQCFDLRIVERAKSVIAQRKQWERQGKVPPRLTGDNP